MGADMRSRLCGDGSFAPYETIGMTKCEFTEHSQLRGEFHILANAADEQGLARKVSSPVPSKCCNAVA